MTDHKPTIIMIRPVIGARQFVDALGEQAALPAIIFDPLIEIEFLDVEVPAPADQTFIFTSANGVRAYCAQHSPTGQRAYCVNETTAKVATTAGFSAIAGHDDASALATMILGDDLVYVRAEQTSFDMKAALFADGATFTEYPAYRQMECNFTPKARKVLRTKPTIIPVFSMFGAQTLVKQFDDNGPYNVVLVCISKQVGAVFDAKANIQIYYASEPHRASMIAAMLDVIT